MSRRHSAEKREINPDAKFGNLVDLALFCGMSAGHDDRSYFGRFAPYFERRCLRFLTPWVSSTPRRM